MRKPSFSTNAPFQVYMGCMSRCSASREGAPGWAGCLARFCFSVEISVLRKVVRVASVVLTPSVSRIPIDYFVSTSTLRICVLTFSLVDISCLKVLRQVPLTASKLKTFFLVALCSQSSRHTSCVYQQHMLICIPHSLESTPDLHGSSDFIDDLVIPASRRSQTLQGY